MQQFNYIVSFRVGITDCGKLSHCGLRRGVLTHGSSSDQKKEEEKNKPLSAFVYHISEASITATMVWLTPERN